MVTETASANLASARWAPYAPPYTVLGVVKHFRDSDIPPQIERTRLTQIGVTDGLLNRTWATLVFLGLIHEDGTALEPFRSLRFASDDEYSEVFRGILRAAYCDIFAVLNPETAQQKDYDNAFRPYSPGGQRGRMITLFVGLCKHANFDLKVQQNERSTNKETPNRSKARQSSPKNPRTPVIDFVPHTPPAPLGEIPSMTNGGDALPIYERDLAELSEDEFRTVWDALGIVYRSRGKWQVEREKAAQASKSGIQLPMLGEDGDG